MATSFLSGGVPGGSNSSGGDGMHIEPAFKDKDIRYYFAKIGLVFGLIITLVTIGYIVSIVL